MSRHLTNQEINGYIHHTLTDAQRESMDRHLDACPLCREKIDNARRLQRHVHYDLMSTLRQIRPSDGMGFTAVTPNLNRARKLAKLRFHSMQMLANVATLAMLVFLAGLLFFALQRSRPATSAESASTRSDLLNVQWEDTTLYDNGLIKNEQSMLARLSTASIYHIDVTLADNLKALQGRQEVRYTNNSGQTLHEIYFRLLPNENEPALTVTNVAVNGRAADTFLPKPTALRVTLPQPLLPQEQVVVEMDFELDVAQSHQAFTSASAEGVLALSSFYPTIAPYRQGAWKTEMPSHGSSGHSEDSFYLVRIKAPTITTIITSGVEVKQETAADSDEMRQILTFAAGPISRFYLTASNWETLVYSDKVGETRINSYINDQYLILEAQEALHYARDALQSFTAHFGPYPFTELDLIGVPALTSERGVTTYPNIVLLASNRYSQRDVSLESAVAYGIAYHWFGRIAGYNSTDEPWLAAAVSEFATLYYYIDAYGPDEEQMLQNEWFHSQQQASSRLLPVGLPAYAYTPAQYRVAMHASGPYYLYQIALRGNQNEGLDTFARVLRNYYQTYQWGIIGDDGPMSATFKQLAETHCACDLTATFDKWIYGKSAG